MTRTVADMAVLLDVIAGPENEDKATAASVGRIPRTYTSGLTKSALKGARLGVLRQMLTPAMTDPRILAQFQSTIEELRSAGAEVIDPLTVPEFDSIPRPPQTRAQSKEDLTQWFAKYPGMPFPSVKAIAASKLLHPLHQPVFDEMVASKPAGEDPETNTGLRNEQRYREAFTRAMEANKIDAIISPIMAQLPAINGDRNTQLVAEPKPGAAAGPTALGSSLTFVASSLQWPALSVPAGYLGEGLPQGLQILGRAWDEAKIIAYAYAYEQATHHRRPPAAVPPLRESLISRFLGTWRLIGTARGQLMYAADGRFSLQVVQTGRSGFSTFGRWELAAAEECVIHLPDAGLNSKRGTAPEKRRYSFDASGRLTLTAPVSGGTGTALVWERQP